MKCGPCAFLESASSGQFASFAAHQADRVASERKVGALSHSTPRCLPAGEGDERLPAPLATQVIQDENRVRLELEKELKRQ